LGDVASSPIAPLSADRWDFRFRDTGEIAGQAIARVPVENDPTATSKEAWTARIFVQLRAA
jgi:hypothetical protein